MDMPMPETGAEPVAEAPEGDQGFTVCINKYPDGTFSVYKEPLVEEANEAPMAGAPDDQGDEEKIDSVEGALKEAYGYLQEGGDSGAEADMESAYSEGADQNG